MKICFNKQNQNSEKHPMMPDDYPYLIYEVDDDFTCPDYFFEMSLSDFESYKLNFDLTDFINATKPPRMALTAKQIRLGLLALGISPIQVEAEINKMSEPDKSKALIDWEYSSSYHREHQLVQTIAYALNFNNQQIDDFWDDALKL